MGMGAHEWVLGRTGWKRRRLSSDMGLHLGRCCIVVWWKGWTGRNVVVLNLLNLSLVAGVHVVETRWAVGRGHDDSAATRRNGKSRSPARDRGWLGQWPGVWIWHRLFTLEL